LGGRSGSQNRTADPRDREKKTSRAGTSTHLRTYHLYSISTGENETSISNRKFVAFSRKYLDPRGGGGHSKAKTIRDFLSFSENLSWLHVFMGGSVEEPDHVLCGAVFECLAAKSSQVSSAAKCRLWLVFSLASD